MILSGDEIEPKVVGGASELDDRLGGRRVEPHAHLPERDPPDAEAQAPAQRKTPYLFSGSLKIRTALPASMSYRSWPSTPVNCSLIVFREYGQSLPWCG